MHYKRNNAKYEFLVLWGNKQYLLKFKKIDNIELDNVFQIPFMQKDQTMYTTSLFTSALFVMPKQKTILMSANIDLLL